MVMKAYEDFKDEVVRKYKADYGCGQKMSDEEIAHEFDLIIGHGGYAELERVEKLLQKRNQPFDPVKRACDQMDMVI